MKKLYLMRHGQTLFNQLNKIQGSCDAPLTKLGQQQAQKAQKYFQQQEIIFDHLYVSTQERAIDTLELATNFQQPYTRLKALKEMNFGLFEGESMNLQPKYPTAYEEFYGHFGGETAPQVRQRMVTVLSEIMEQEDHQQVLTVSHNRAIKCFLQAINGEQENILPQPLANCGFIVFGYHAGSFKFLELVDPNQ